jgi:hypothetical protein
MHDQLRDMGQRGVKEASNYEYRKQSRTWDKEEARMLLSNQTIITSSSNVHQSFNRTHW